MEPAKSVPPRTDDNVIVAAFNVQWLGQLEHDRHKLPEPCFSGSNALFFMT